MTICIGDVFLLRCTLCQPPKTKFFVVASPDPLLMFLINSSVPPFMQNKPALLDVQVPVPVAEHAFLRHDSLLDAHHISFEYSREHLLRLLENNPSRRKGRLSDRTLLAVNSVLPNSRTIKRKHRDLLVDLWATECESRFASGAGS